MRRYGDRIMNIPADDGVALIEFAFNDEFEHNVFLRWIAGHEFGMSFDQFKEESKPRPIKTSKEVLSDVEKILNTTKWRKSS